MSQVPEDEEASRSSNQVNNMTMCSNIGVFVVFLHYRDNSEVRRRIVDHRVPSIEHELKLNKLARRGLVQCMSADRPPWC